MAAKERLQLGRYELYKTGTEKVVDWITQTASRCIDISPFITTGKPKSSNRVKARALVTLAEAIVSAHRNSTSPPTGTAVTFAIVELLREVIEGRQAAADWYALQPASDEAEAANEAHQFFIDILRQVHGLLASVQQPRSFESAKKKTASGKIKVKSLENDLNNLFSQLELEEPANYPLGNSPKVSRAQANPQKPCTHTVLQDDAENTTFLLWCHLEDMRDVRLYVHDVWLEYAAGNISLLTATMVTETAFGLMRISDERFVSTHGAFNDWWYLPHFLSFQGQDQAHAPSLGSNKDAQNAEKLASRQDADVLLCTSAAFMLRDLAQNMNDAIVKEEQDPYAEIPQHLMSECYDFEYLLNQCTSDFIAIRTVRAWHKHETRTRQTHQRTEFVEGLAEYLEGTKAPIWLVCAFQLYRDIYEVIGSQPCCASDSYLDQLTRIEKQSSALHPHLKQHVKAMDPWFKQRESFEGLVRTTHEGWDQSRQKGLVPSLNSKDTPSGHPLVSLAGLPCAAGQMLYISKVMIHQIGLSAANVEFAVLAMAHLYQAARKSGLIKLTWQDMEMVISQQSKKMKPLVIKPSKNADAYEPLRHYHLCLGVSAADICREGASKLPQAKELQKGARRTTVTSEYMLAMLQGNTENSELGFSRGDLSENILKQLTKDKEGVEPTQHTVVDLLTTFKKSLIADEPYLNFDYLAFWGTCKEFLQGVGYALQSREPDTSNALMMTPTVVVHHLLEDGAKAAVQGRSVAFSKMGVAAKLLEEFIAAEGNKIAQEAFKQSSGRIPKSLRPTLVYRSVSKTRAAQTKD